MTDVSEKKQNRFIATTQKRIPISFKKLEKIIQRIRIKTQTTDNKRRQIMYKKLSVILTIFALITIVVIYSCSSDEANPVAPNGGGGTKKIVFYSDRSGNYDIWTVNCDGSQLKQITTNSGNDVCPRWSFSGDKIAYISDSSGSFKIHIIDINDENNITVLVPLMAINNSSIAWIPNDADFIYTTDDACANYLRRFNTSTPTDIIFEDSSDIQYMPDCNILNQVLYIDGDCGGGSTMHIWKINLDKSGNQNITTNDGKADGNPRWDSTGTKIIFGENTIGAYSYITIMNSDGSGRYAITNCTGYVGDFGFNNSKIIFQRVKDDNPATGLYNIWMMNLDGSGLQQITSGDYMDLAPDIN